MQARVKGSQRTGSWAASFPFYGRNEGMGRAILLLATTMALVALTARGAGRHRRRKALKAYTYANLNGTYTLLCLLGATPQGDQSQEDQQRKTAASGAGLLGGGVVVAAILTLYLLLRRRRRSGVSRRWSY